MADEPQTSSATSGATAAQTTQTQTEPLGNQPEARNPDGSLKDTQTAKSTDTTEPKADAESGDKGGDKNPKDGKNAPQGAPEKYEAFKVPDGYELDAKVLEAASPVFKDLNLSQDQAQKLVDFYANASKDAAAENQKAYEDMRNEWRGKVSSDKDLGNGSDLKPEVKANIGRMLDLVPTADRTAFLEAMDLTGAGDHPAVLRVINALASRVSEGKLVAGGVSTSGQPGARPRSAAAALFPNLPSAS